MKYYDALHTGTMAATTNWANKEQDPVGVGTICAPSQGPGPQQRDGRKLLVKSIHVTGIINRPAQVTQSAPQFGGSVFIALVQDKQTNGAQLNSEDVYTNPVGSSVTSSCPVRTMETSDRFKVWATTRLTFGPPPIANGVGTVAPPTMIFSGNSIPFEFYVTPNVVMQMTGTTVDIANCVDNSFHIVAAADWQPTDPLDIVYNARTRFIG